MRGLTRFQAEFINWSILIGGSASGIFVSNKAQFYEGMLNILGLLIISVNTGALLTYILCKIFGKRIQSYKEEKPRWAFEIWETFRCLWTISILTAWPYYRYKNGDLTAYVWHIEESTPGSGILANVIYFFIAFLFIDFYTYWKHRLLHHKKMFCFHSQHHSIHDPTPFGGFAVCPVEAVLTFGLILFQCIPIANELKFYFPLHSSLILFQVILNLYLHAGYVIAPIEALLPKLFINTSAHHNVHHEKGNKHFSELLTLWDYICGTGATYYNPNQKVKCY